MASIQQFIKAAEESGFVRVECVHADHQHHIVYDYPKALEADGEVIDNYRRVHINTAKVPCVVYLAGTPFIGRKDWGMRATLKAAIAFVRKAQNE